MLQLASFLAFINASIALGTADALGTTGISYPLGMANDHANEADKSRLRSGTISVISFTIMAMILEALLIITRFLNIGYFNNKIKMFLIIVS